MTFSMRSLLAADTAIPEVVRAGIASGDPRSARDLMTLGLTAWEVAELLDEPQHGFVRPFGGCSCSDP